MPRNTKAVKKHAGQPDLGRLPLLTWYVDGKPSPPRAAADGTRTQGTPRASISRAANHGEPRSSGMQSTTQSEHLAQ